MKLLINPLFILLSCIAVGQKVTYDDSLKNLISKTSSTQTKVEYLADLGNYYKKNTIDSLYSIAHQLIILADENSDQCSKAKGYHFKGDYFSEKGEYSDAIAFYNKAINLKERHCTLDEVVETAVEIAHAHYFMADYDMAYMHYYQALGIYEQLNDRSGISASYTNLGLVDVSRRNYKNAEKKYIKSLQYHEGSTDSIQLANIYNNFGGLYQAQDMFDTAVVYFQKAMKIYSRIDHKSGLAHGYNNIGIIYYYQEKEDSCMIYFLKSLEIRKEIGVKSNISQSYNNIGILYGYQEKFELGITYSDSALSLAKKTGLKEEISDAYLNLYEVYLAKKDYHKAVIHLKCFTDYKDTLVSEQKERSMIDMQTKYETVKKESELQEQQLILKQNEEAIKRQRNIIIASTIGAITFAILCLIIYNRNKLTKKQNLIIDQQKQILEQKQKEILDSIYYAKRIQDALLKSEKQESTHLPQHFVLFKPKDIVSGDFYWINKKEDYLYLAVADCTGHGVPGGFLTMLGSSFLNEIVSDDNLPEPATILDELRNKFVAELSQTGSLGESKDGMDVSLVKLNQKTLELSWAGANNPLWVMHNQTSIPKIAGNNISQSNGIIEFKPNKQPIGHFMSMNPFTNHKIQLSKGDMFYLFSDGYADQFGGDKGKKFKYKPFKKLLLETKNMDLNIAKEKIDVVFNEWKGELEQVDDVCVMGVRL